MTGESHAPASTDPAPLLWETVEMLNDRPCFALRRDAARTSHALAAAIEHYLDDLRIRDDAVLAVLPDLTSRIYLAYRDDEQSSEAIASLLGLPVADVERRLDDAIFALAGISGVVAGRRRAGLTPIRRHLAAAAGSGSGKHHFTFTKGMTMTNAPWIEKLDTLPPDGRTRIRRYIEEGCGASLSTFYRCLLSNDLIGAVQGGDAENRAALPAYVDYLTAYAPDGCYGSTEKLYGWRGLSGVEG